MNEKLEAAYEELREIIDGGSKSFTHADAVQYLKDVLAEREQLIIVRDNLFRGMSKSMQKLQARAINEVLGLPNYTQSPKQEQGETVVVNMGLPVEKLYIPPQQEQGEPVAWTPRIERIYKDGVLVEQTIQYNPQGQKLPYPHEPSLPVGKVILYTGEGFACAPFHKIEWSDGMMPPVGTQLYTKPQPSQKPLTDEQLKNHYQNNEWLDGVRFAEQFHGIKE